MWLAIFCAVLSVILAVGAAVFYVCFSLLWVADRLVLFKKSIQSRCPNCKRVSIIPIFACPECGRRHNHLTPGPYGIFQMKCACGNLLPSTAFNGRSKLKAYCPYCNEPLAAAGASQFGIQIAGSISSGKTTYLSAFWDSYKKMLKSSPDIVSFSVSPEDAFTELERWYALGISDATSETNANMYSVIHNIRADNTPYQLSLYDIAGEAFGKLSSDIQQQQFKYCEGVIMIIDSDPKAKPDDTLESFSGFIQEMKRLKGEASDKILNIPAAIVISKADIYLSDIGPAKIDEDFRAQTAKTVWEVQDDICRDFLNRRGYSQVLNLIDASLSHIRMFPVSSMGHQADGTKYASWGVLNPVLWIMSENNCKLYKFLSDVYLSEHFFRENSTQKAAVKNNKSMGYVMASKRLVDEKLPVRFMYREKGEGDDSGWRFFSGTEDRNYADDPNNIGIYDITTILAIDKTIMPYLDSTEGMAFKREEGTGTFKVSSDFGFVP